MKINHTEVEVRYQETDQMGVVHHSNYLVWFEIGRTKYMEQLGFNYANMEKNGVLSPVIDIQISYKKPAKYGDKVFIETWLEDYDGVRTTYRYHVLNELDETVVTGRTIHVVVQKESFKPTLLRKVYPEWHAAYKEQIKGE